MTAAPLVTPGCEACDIAAKHPMTGRYANGCKACGARAVANSPAFAVASASMRFTTDYRARLTQIAQAGETIEQTHARVRAWDRRIAEYRMHGGVEEGVLL